MNQEFYRMQRLAGIITEGEYKANTLFEGEEAENVEKIPDNILSLIAKAAKKSPEQVKQTIKNKEEGKPSEDKVDESIVGIALTLMGLLPLAMEAIGGLSNWISRNTGKSKDEIAQLKAFNKKIEEKEKYIKSLDKKDDKREMKERESLKSMIKQRDDIWGSDLGQWMKHYAHKLHHGYTWPIRTLLKGIGWVTGNKQLKDKKFREKLANILYAITMAGIAGAGILSHLNHLHGVGPVTMTIADGVKEGKSIADIVKSIGLAI